MNATELYSIVKDVPKEAWPKDIRYNQPIPHADGAVQNEGGSWSSQTQEATFSPHKILDDHAELLFEASMVKWLGNRAPLVSRRRGYPETWKVQTCINDDVSVFEESTLIEALASACKAVGGRGATK